MVMLMGLHVYLSKFLYNVSIQIYKKTFSATDMRSKGAHIILICDLLSQDHFLAGIDLGIKPIWYSAYFRVKWSCGDSSKLVCIETVHPTVEPKAAISHFFTGIQGKASPGDDTESRILFALAPFGP
jgi:hypothetical protein